jgi:CO dehydrogenase maturation factor
MDLPAGLEHITRRTSRSVDLMYVLTDSSRMGLETAARIKKFTEKIEKDKIEKIVLIGNRVSPEIGDRIKAKAEEIGVEYGGSVPNDEVLAKLNMEGRSLLELPEDSEAFQAIRKILLEEPLLN